MTRFVVCVVFCVIGALLIEEIKTHPLNPDERNIDNNGIFTVGTYERKFNLPTAVTDGMTIVIKGTMNTDDETFTAALKKADDATLFTFQYDFTHKTIRVEYPNCNTPPCIQHQTSYELNTALYKLSEPSFSLTLTAKVNFDGGEDIDAVFEANEQCKNGPSDVFSFPINFSDIEYIIMQEGVHQVRSLLFDYKWQN